MSLPEKFGRYKVLDVLGQGAMGLVYRAVDPVIERHVAIKVIQTDAGLSAGDLERIQARFEQEFRSAGALSHANIVTVFDVGKEGDLHYIAMEYVKGRSLDTVLAEQGVLSFEQVGDLAMALSSALDYAHERGVVHRDIKPANVLITADGSAKITDFGLAKLEATTLTRTGALVGTPAFMSPEQVGGHAIEGASDQFSLAILLYQALTGERPFTGDTPPTIMYKIVHEEPLPPGHLNKSLPDAVNATLLRSLQKSTEDRFATCLEMATSLCEALATSPPAVASTTTAAAQAGVETVVETPDAVDPAAETSLKPPPATPLSLESPAAAHSKWLIGVAIIFPSMSLLALITWLVTVGPLGGPRQEPADEQLTAAGAAVEEPPGAGDSSTADPIPRVDPAPDEPPDQPVEVRPRFSDDAGDAARGGRGNRTGNRLGNADGLPDWLQQAMESGQVDVGTLRVESPIPVAVRVAPTGRDFLMSLPRTLRERIAETNQESRRRLMSGFVFATDSVHDIDLPAGNWRVTLIAPRNVVLFSHEEDVVLRKGQTANLSDRVPSEIVFVRISSQPAGARVRIGAMPAIPTPYNGRMLVGAYEFQFIWGDATATVRATIDRNGQEIVGRR